MHALGLEFGSAAQLSKRPSSVWNCLWGNALKRSPGIICKSRVSYPGPGFLSSATWPSLPKKHYNGFNQTKQKSSHIFLGCYRFHYITLTNAKSLDLSSIKQMYTNGTGKPPHPKIWISFNRLNSNIFYSILLLK